MGSAVDAGPVEEDEAAEVGESGAAGVLGELGAKVLVDEDAEVETAAERGAKKDPGVAVRSEPKNNTEEASGMLDLPDVDGSGEEMDAAAQRRDRGAQVHEVADGDPWIDIGKGERADAGVAIVGDVRINVKLVVQRRRRAVRDVGNAEESQELVEVAPLVDKERAIGLDLEVEAAEIRGDLVPGHIEPCVEGRTNGGDVVVVSGERDVVDDRKHECRGSVILDPNKEALVEGRGDEAENVEDERNEGLGPPPPRDGVGRRPVG